MTPRSLVLRRPLARTKSKWEENITIPGGDKVLWGPVDVQLITFEALRKYKMDFHIPGGLMHRTEIQRGRGGYILWEGLDGKATGVK
jgi:hypothetical protein